MDGVEVLPEGMPKGECKRELCETPLVTQLHGPGSKCVGLHSLRCHALIPTCR